MSKVSKGVRACALRTEGPAAKTRVPCSKRALLLLSAGGARCWGDNSLTSIYSFGTTPIEISADVCTRVQKQAAPEIHAGNPQERSFSNHGKKHVGDSYPRFQDLR